MYTRFFGFKESPFNPSPDPKFLYLSRSHRETLASMFYGIEQRRGFIAVIGEVGSGKTTLIHSLLKSLDNRTKTAFIFYPPPTYSDLLRKILLEFNIDTEGKNEFDMQLKFHHFVIDQFRRGGNVAIILDEAQHISRDVLEQLRLLSNLEAPEEKLFQIMLVGQPELSSKLNQPELRQIRQRIVIRREIEPLTYSEVRSYIKHRLRVAGDEGNLKPFSENALDLISRYSRGIPRMVNILCDNSLLIAYGLGKKKIDESILKEVLADLKIDNSAEGKTPDPEHHVAHRLTIKTLRRRLWPRAALPFALVVLVIFLIQGITFLIQEGAVNKKSLWPLNRVEETFQGIVIPQVKERPLDTVEASERNTEKKKEEMPITLGTEEKESLHSPTEESSQVAVTPLVEEKIVEIAQGAQIDQKSEKKGRGISLVNKTPEKEPLHSAANQVDVGPTISWSWAVQVFSDKSFTSARGLKEQLEDNGFHAYIVAGANPWYGVRVGFYATRQEALETGKKIRSEFDIKDYFAVRVRRTRIEQENQEDLWVRPLKPLSGPREKRISKRQ